MTDKIKAVMAFFFVFIFVSNAHVVLEYISPISEVYWFLLISAVSGTLFLLTPFETLRNIPKAALIWTLFFFISTTIAYIFSSQSQVVTDVIIIIFKPIIVFFSMFVLINTPTALKAALYGLLAVIIFSSFNNIVEFFTEISEFQWSSIPGRASGWQLNANRSGKFLALSLLFASIITPKKFIWPLIALTSIAVLVTFSRSTWVELFIIIVGISLIRGTPVGQKISLLDIKPSNFIAIAVGATVASTLLIILLTGQAYQIVKGTVIEDLLSEDTMLRISGDRTDDSANERVEILVDALKIGAEHPFLGAGLARTYEWHHDVGPHNDYATLFAERGVTGVIMYLVLLLTLWFTGSRSAKLFVLVLAFSSIATHNTFEQPATYIFIALAFLHRDEFNLLEENQQPYYPT